LTEVNRIVTCGFCFAGRFATRLVWRRVTLNERIELLRSDLAAQRTVPERLAWLVARSRSLPAPPPELRGDANLVPGCLSKLWLTAELRAGRCWFQSDSDSQVVRAVAGALCGLASDSAPAEILAAETDLPARLGLDRLLTPNRRAAQSRIWERIRAFAATHAPP
jgi:cysteine desulfuration protein SufE